MFSFWWDFVPTCVNLPHAEMLQRFAERPVGPSNSPRRRPRRRLVRRRLTVERGTDWHERRTMISLTGSTSIELAGRAELRAVISGARGGAWQRLNSDDSGGSTFPHPATFFCPCEDQAYVYQKTQCQWIARTVFLEVAKPDRQDCRSKTDKLNPRTVYTDTLLWCCDLDLDLDTVYELDLDISKLYLCTENERPDFQ